MQAVDGLLGKTIYGEDLRPFDDCVSPTKIFKHKCDESYAYYYVLIYIDEKITFEFDLNNEFIQKINHYFQTLNLIL